MPWRDHLGGRRWGNGSRTAQFLWIFWTPPSLTSSCKMACPLGYNNILFHCQKHSCLGAKLYGPPSHWDLVMVLKLLQEPKQGQPVMQGAAFWTGKPSVIGCFSKCGLQINCFSQIWSWVSTWVSRAHLGPHHSEPGGLFPQGLSHSKTLILFYHV